MRGTQVRIDRHELDAILRHAFGERRHGVTATQIGAGQVNDARLLTWPDDTQRILRVAPSDATADAGPSWFTAYGLRREVAVIAAAHDLASYLPVTTAHDFERAVIDRDWVIQEVMPGTPLSEVDRNLGPDVREDVWEQIGAFTRRLHNVRGHWFGPPANGPRFDTWSGLLEWDAAGLIRDAKSFQYDSSPFERLARIVSAQRALLDEVKTPSLIHSDLCRTHIFVEPVDGQWRLVGTIDIEFGRFADRLSEHLITGFEWANAPPEMRPAFMRSYLAMGETDSDRRRVAIYVALSLAWFAPLLAMQHEPVDGLLRRLGDALDRLDAWA
jgi:aminoglycoside phosphotransferase (APT) family kinase protein